jgi:hypothetical protein
MTRNEFITNYVELIGRNRRLNFPEMRLSEVAASRVHDRAQALKMWRRSGAVFGPMTAGEFRAFFPKPRTAQEHPFTRAHPNSGNKYCTVCDVREEYHA